MAFPTLLTSESGWLQSSVSSASSTFTGDTSVISLLADHPFVCVLALTVLMLAVSMLRAR